MDIISQMTKQLELLSLNHVRLNFHLMIKRSQYLYYVILCTKSKPTMMTFRVPVSLGNSTLLYLLSSFLIQRQLVE